MEFKKWLSEMPLAHYGNNFKDMNGPEFPGPGKETPWGDRGQFNINDKIIIKHPKTVATLERLLSRHRWKFNILMYETHSENMEEKEFTDLVKKWMHQNKIEIWDHITFAKNGSSGDLMTPWMILHTIGHAINDETTIGYSIIEFLKKVYTGGPMSNEELIGKLSNILQFKSIANMGKINTKMKLAPSSAQEFVNELIAEYLWNGKIRYKPSATSIEIQSLAEVEQAIAKNLDNMVGRIIIDYFV